MGADELILTEDFELTLFDRLESIRKHDEMFNLKENAYLSFSGGKDSTVLHHLIDMAIPGNRIPRVFIDTGIELCTLYYPPRSTSGERDAKGALSRSIWRSSCPLWSCISRKRGSNARRYGSRYTTNTGESGTGCTKTSSLSCFKCERKKEMKIKDFDKSMARNICHSQDNCNGCPFDRGGFCLKELVDVKEETKDQFGFNVLTEEALNIEVDLKEEKK